MTLDTQTPQIPTTSALEISQQKQEFNWRQCWYPVCFVRDLPTNCPYSFSLYDEPFVLFKNKDGQFVCLTDCCPHRAARLSDGQIIDGRIECLYHGWQFGTATIYYIGVLPEYRGQGFAIDLLSKGTRVLQDVGVWRVFCDTDVKNIPMISTFERVGYQQYSEPWQRPL